MRVERVPPVRPRREFDLLGILARSDVTGVGPVRLRRKTGLHPVEIRVIRAVLDPEAPQTRGR